MEWIFLGLAILLEVSGAVCLKLSEGFTRLGPSIAIFPLYATSFVFLTFAVKVIPISMAYAIWSGVGTAAITVIGFGLFREPMTATKLAFLSLIVVGVVGLHVADRTPETG